MQLRYDIILVVSFLQAMLGLGTAGIHRGLYDRVSLHVACWEPLDVTSVDSDPRKLDV